MTRLTAVVLAGDCQDQLAGCLESLRFADVVLVVDSAGNPRTREIAADHGAQVVERPLERFDEQRNWAQEQVETDWVLFVDCDERVSRALQQEIRGVLGQSAGPAAYSMPRRNHFLGRWIRRCGWGRDRVVRLLRPTRARWHGAVHEKPKIQGTTGSLAAPLIHHSYPTLSVYWDKMLLYSRLAAAQDFERGKRSGFLRLVVRPKAMFLRMYVLRGGWLEGRHGLVLCLLSAFSAFTRALRLWEHHLGASGRSVAAEGPPVQAPHQGGPELSILVPTHNEAVNIEGVLDSVRWADEVLVVDSFSDDGTVEAARRRADRVLVHEYINSAAQKNWALPQTRHPWAMVVDADERVTPELAREVREVLASGPPARGFIIRRVNHFHGQRIRYCGWNRDRVLRLFNREHARYQELEVHAEVDVEGKVSTLRHPLLHFTFRNVDQYWPKVHRYTDWGASQAYTDGQRATLHHLVLHPVGRFIKMYLLRLGLLDGTRGLAICLISFFSVFNKYAKLWEKGMEGDSVRRAMETGELERMTSLTILHVNTENGFRGGEIQNLHLADGLSRRGHRCVLAVQLESALGDRAEERDLDVHRRPMQGEFDPLAVAWLSGLIEQERPHIMHYHTSHAVTLGTLARLGRKGPATVVTRRTSFPTRRNPLFRLKFSYRLDHIIAVSGSIKQDMVEAGLPPARISVVHSGIDLQRFRAHPDGSAFRRELGVGPGDLLLGCVGALAPQKGHGHLLDVMVRLSEHFPRLHLALLGEGELQEFILDEARSLGIGDRVHLAGFREEIPQANAAFDVAVLPSVAGEGSPAVVKEAMAVGVPVVATRIGGVAEILEDGRQGLLVPADDPAALAQAVESLLKDPGRRRSMGEAGRIRVEEFSMEQMIRRTEEIYQLLCGIRGDGQQEPACSRDS